MKKLNYRTRTFTIIVSALYALFNGSAAAHEPLFGLGPHTVGKYSWALESEFERGERGWFNNYELLYGIAPDFAVTAVLPYVFSQQGRKAGFGDFVLRGKYRFLRVDFLNGSKAFALHWGIKFPTGSRSELRGSGALDAFGGLSFGLESRKHYAFADIRYQIRGAVDNIERANVLNFDAAYGIRPWKLEYLQPDLVILGEILGEAAGKNSVDSIDDANSGGFVLSFAPGILFSYRNMMFKGGVKFAVLENLNGLQEKPDPEFVFAVEFHMPPFK
jgi:hypothetical protein